MRTRRTRQAALVVAASAGLLAPFLLYVRAHIEIVTTGYRIESTEERLKKAEQENRVLRLDLARLAAAPRVEEEAKRLGLVPLGPTRVVVLVAERSALRHPAPPATPPADPRPQPASTPAEEAR